MTILLAYKNTKQNIPHYIRTIWT